MGATASIDDWKASVGQDVIDELKWGTRDISKAAREVVDLMNSKEIPEEEAKAEILERYRNLPPIRLVDFDVFKKLGEIPRLGSGESMPSAPSTADLTVPLTSIDRGKTFIVFISHSWMAGWDGLGKEGQVVDEQMADEWRGYPHPDNKANAKFKLQVEGIQWLIKTMAPGCKTYIWQDFSCMDQNGSPAVDLKQLDKIMEMSDCIFTPIVDPNHDTWDYPPGGWHDYFTQYAAKSFSVGPNAYVNRAWCRVEMLYAANIPLRESEIDYKFRAGLQDAMKMNLRPHYLYGNKEKRNGVPPYQIPALAKTHLESLSPVACISNLTAASDAEKIHSLMTELQPYLKKAEGYKGAKSEDGKRHGWGKGTYANGDIYEGDYENDNFHGKGKFTFTNGNIYEGDWVNGKRHGKGKFTWANNDVYEGDWEHGKKHGKGTFTYSDGDVYQGDWVVNKKHGRGDFTCASGSIYEGDWKDGKMNGKGKFTYTSGEVYEGDWRDDNMHGIGTFTYASGNVYQGEYKDNNMHGSGKFSLANGNVYEGEYKDNNMHGKGKVTWASGNVYIGDWKDGKKHGKGTFTYATGDIYEGDWKDGNMHGYGKFTYEGGSVYEGEYRDNTMYGKGKFTYANGEVHEGDWKDDKEVI